MVQGMLSICKELDWKYWCDHLGNAFLLLQELRQLIAVSHDIEDLSQVS